MNPETQPRQRARNSLPLKLTHPPEPALPLVPPPPVPLDFPLGQAESEAACSSGCVMTATLPLSKEDKDTLKRLQERKNEKRVDRQMKIYRRSRLQEVLKEVEKAVKMAKELLEGLHKEID
jgi:hypothetical protein